jgi:hypothetical protein
MPLVDVHAPVGLFPEAAERPLAEQLARAVLRWEGVPEPTALLLENT